MPVDKTVIEAMQKAVENDPQSVSLRLYLASLLLYAGEHTVALQHFAHVLTIDPAHTEALRGAAAAATGLGETARAEGYRKLLLSLGAPPAPPKMSPPPPPILDSNKKEAVPEKDGSDDEAEELDSEIPRITLKDVGGMEEVKRRLNLAFLAPLRNPKMREMYGKSLRGGLLLYGPPGCGKTFIARAIAGELGARFYSIGISDVLDMWLGNSEKRLHQIFENARRNSPSLLFFDEVDALGHKRSQFRGVGGRNVVNALLSEMDGVSDNNKGVFVLAATNHPWDVDAALRRPGRFDRMLLVLPPDAAARTAILQLLLKDRPAEDVDAAWLANQTDGLSGADLAYLCESAAESAMEESLTTGHVRAMTVNDFKRALKEVRPSCRSWFETAKNYALFANEGGVYDDLIAYLKAHRYA